MRRQNSSGSNSNDLSGTSVALPERGRVELVASFQGWSTAPKLPNPPTPRWRLRATLLFLVQEWKGGGGGVGGGGLGGLGLLTVGARPE